MKFIGPQINSMKATELEEQQAPAIAPAVAVSVPISAEMIAHEQDVTNFLISAGSIECKKRKRKLLAMNSHSFQVLKLNSVIGTFCKVQETYELYIYVLISLLDYYFLFYFLLTNLLLFLEYGHTIGI